VYLNKSTGVIQFWHCTALHFLEKSAQKAYSSAQKAYSSAQKAYSSAVFRTCAKRHLEI
jgi:hypothetical protein